MLMFGVSRVVHTLSQPCKHYTRQCTFQQQYVCQPGHSLVVKAEQQTETTPPSSLPLFSEAALSVSVGLIFRINIWWSHFLLLWNTVWFNIKVMNLIGDLLFTVLPAETPDVLSLILSTHDKNINLIVHTSKKEEYFWKIKQLQLIYRGLVNGQVL